MLRFPLVIGRTSPALVVFMAAASAGLLNGCKPSGERMEITETREISKHDPLPPAGITSARRFPLPPAEETQEEMPAPAKTPPPEDIFDWVTPEGWTVVPPNPASQGMRMLDLRFGAGQEGQCYLSFLPGGGGGVAANINRWRTQMGQSPLSDDEIRNLATKPLFGRPATFISIDGDFTDVGQTTPKKDYRLIGALHADDQFMMFVTMVGPKSVVEQNQAAFDQFCTSLQPKVVR